jgi:hypothetical protein
MPSPGRPRSTSSDRRRQTLKPQRAGQPRFDRQRSSLRSASNTSTTSSCTTTLTRADGEPPSALAHIWRTCRAGRSGRLAVMRSGQRVDRWTLVAPLGSGASGEVWAAKDGAGREVALKILKKRRPGRHIASHFQDEIELYRRRGGRPGSFRWLTPVSAPKLIMRQLGTHGSPWRSRYQW